MAAKQPPKRGSDTEPTKSSKKAATPKPNPVTSQEAKDLNMLIKTLGQKNEPVSSKEITEYAKKTLKVVELSQKSDSASFKREATKALLNFKELVEKSTKLTDTRRDKLLGDINSVTLDLKNANFVMLSNAKAQAKQIAVTAKNEASLTKLKAKQDADAVLSTAKLKAKEIAEEAKLKSKDFTEEQSNKRRQFNLEHKAKMDAILAESVEQAKLRKEKARNRYDALILAAKDREERIKLDLANKKAELENDKVIQALKIKAAKEEAAEGIKKAKTEADEKLMERALKQKEILAEQKAEADRKNKARIKRIREAEALHKLKLKQMSDDHRADLAKNKSLAKRKANKELEKKDKRDKRINEVKSKGKEVLQDSAPISHAIGALGADIFSLGKKFFSWNSKRKTQNPQNDEDSDDQPTNRRTRRVNPPPAPAPANNSRNPPLIRRRTTRDPNAPRISKILGFKNKKSNSNNPPRAGRQPNRPAPATPNANPSPTPAGNNSPAPQPDNDSGGLFGNILSMLPSVMGLISGIGSMFTGIFGFVGKLGGLLKMGGRAIPFIGIAVSVVMAIWDFVEGFQKAAELFGDGLEPSIFKKVFAGVVNVVSNLLGIFDTVAGWFGFDTNLKKSFEEGAVSLYKKVEGVIDMIINGAKMLMDGMLVPYRFLAKRIGKLIDLIPGMEDNEITKSIKAFGDGGNAPSAEAAVAPISKPTTQDSKAAIAPIINAKQNRVDNLKDSAAVNKATPAVAVVNSDNSVNTNQTIIQHQRLSTRNDEPTHTIFGYAM